MAAADNPYFISPANPLSALMQGTQGYEQGRKYDIQNQQLAGRQEAMQALQSGGDPRGALAKLIGIGDTQGASAIATYAKNQQQQQQFQQQFGETQRMNTATIANQAAQRGLQSRGLDIQESGQNKIIPFGGTLVDNEGKVLRQADAGGLLDGETLNAMADQYMAGDTSVLTNLGRGAQGAENIVKLRKTIAQKTADAGQGGADRAMSNAEFMGAKAAARTVGVKGANIDLAATEFNQVLPVVVKASESVNRTNYPILNKIIQAAQEGTGDPNIVAFGGGLNTLVNIYARAISPQGVGTVADKEHAREILQKAWSQGQFNAAVGMMKQEIDAALNSPTKVREEQRKRFLSGQPGAQQAPQQQAAPQQAAPQQTSTGVPWRIVQ